MFEFRVQRGNLPWRMRNSTISLKKEKYVPFFKTEKELENTGPNVWSRDCLSVTATRYRLAGSGLDTQWQQDILFSTPVDTDVGTQPATCTIGIVVGLPSRMKSDEGLMVNIHTIYIYVIIIIIITIIIIINCNWVVTRWQWLFYMYTNIND